MPLDPLYERSPTRVRRENVPLRMRAHVLSARAAAGAIDAWRQAATPGRSRSEKSRPAAAAGVQAVMSRPAEGRRNGPTGDPAETQGDGSSSSLPERPGTARQAASGPVRDVPRAARGFAD